MKYLKLTLLTSLLCSALLMFGQDTFPKRGTSVEGITEYQLENGLKVLLFPDPSKQTITVNITYLVGSRHENYGETGMAHLLEHLVFKGTPDHENIPKELSDHGARPNGTTWFDRTNYFETFAATEENLRWALDLEADRMVNSFIAKEDLESEMTVVRNEYESGENFPSSVLQKRLMATGYLWQNYGNTTIGARSEIENVPIDRLQALYVGNYLLGGGFLNSRLAVRIRQKEGLSYGVGSFFNADGMEPSATFGAQAICNPENKEKLEKAFFEETQKIHNEGFTQEELDAAKKGLSQSNMVSRAQDETLLIILNNNMMFQRDMNYYEDFDQRTQELTL